jgi:FtsP/CotA-like multicopper oxidase with cupredoxin domain
MSRWPVRIAITSVALVTIGMAGDPLPRIGANDNRAPAGRESRGVLRLRLEARLGRWYPQADSGPSQPIEAFAEEGHRPLVPGPLVRVRTGTRIEIRLRNKLVGKTLVVYGLHARPGSPHDTIQIAPGAVRDVRFAAGEPGTYFYWGSTTGDDIDHRKGVDSQLSGAIVVDSASAAPAGREPRDRVFVIGAWEEQPDTTGPKPWIGRDQMVINGKSWPFTERFAYTVGDTVRWRWVNPTADAHPMHLHGFFYTVESAGTWSRDTLYAAADRRNVVTEMMLPGTTMAIRWVPSEPGNWLFHCHFAFHVSPYLSLNKIPDADDPETMGHGVADMAGLVLGMKVRPARAQNGSAPAARTTHVAAREIRLLIQSAPKRFVRQTGPASFDSIAGYGFVLDSKTTPVPRDSIPVLSPTLVLRRGEPVRVTLVNHLRAPTAVHWHGIELKDSYFDGVPGWSGAANHLAPAIKPGESFVAEFTPPRAGTYMYHSHSNEGWQITSGLYGAIVVVDSEHPYDTTTDRMFVLGENGPDANHARVNGLLTPAPETLTVGTTYRFRIVHINPDWRVFASLMADSSVQRWRAVAKDGADLPAHQATMRAARVLMGAGETADFEYTPIAPGLLRLEFATMLTGWRLAVPLRVEPAKH